MSSNKYGRRGMIATHWQYARFLWHSWPGIIGGIHVLFASKSFRQQWDPRAAMREQPPTILDNTVEVGRYICTWVYINEAHPPDQATDPYQKVSPIMLYNVSIY